MNLMLHPKKGLNPRMTTCRNCGKDVGIVLLGIHEGVYECTSSRCRQKHIGRPEDGRCVKCGLFSPERTGKIGEHEKLPIELCGDCKAKQDACDEEVRKGGIHWKCKDCGSTGAIKAGHPLAEKVREHSKIAAPDPVGVEFTKEDCPLCTETVRGE